MGKKRKSVYPGVEPRNSSIRIHFTYRGVRCRETLKIPPIPANEKYASNLLGKIKFEIAQGCFDYGAHFPESSKATWGSSRKARTLADVADTWKKTLTVAESTQKAYLKYLKNHILPSFGSRLIDTISLSELKVWRASLTARYKPKTVNQIQLIIRAIFALAHGDGVIDADPTAHLKNVRNPRVSDADPFTPEELASLLEAALKRDEQLANMLDLWWITGLRPSELIALQWQDIDWTSRRIHIRRANVDNQETHGKSMHERFVDVKPRGMAALTRQKAHTFSDGQEIFLGATGKPMGDCQMLNKRVHRLFNAAGVRARKPYQFRHTFASMMLSSGERPFYVARQMGHGSLMMLERHYAKWMDGAQAWDSFDDAIQSVEDNLGQIWAILGQFWAKKCPVRD